MFGSVAQCFIDSFKRHAGKKAIAFYRDGTKDAELTYRQIDQESNRATQGLMRMGIKKGDRVILFMPKSLFFVITYIALQKIGAISVPLNPRFKKAEMEYFIKDVDPKLIVCGVEEKRLIEDLGTDVQTLVYDTHLPFEDLDVIDEPLVEKIAGEISPEDPGLIIYTSGTTGKPKGAILTQTNLIHDALNIINVWEIESRDVICHALPLFHVHGLCFAFHTALLAGATVVMLNEFKPEHVIRILSDKKGDEACTVFMAVPAMYIKLLDYLGESRLDVTHIRLWTCGSAPLLPKHFEQIREVLGKEPVEREGMTETGMNFSNPLYGKRKPGSVGLPMPGLEVRVVDPESGVDVPYGEVGELWLRGPCITPGYWRKPEETRKAFTDGWFRTGDLGRIDEEGYFYITDRLKHIIISGGENISPKEIEDVINQHPDVLESCVVGVADERWGERVVAAVVPRTGCAAESEELKSHCRRYLHDWKCPKDIRVLPELPKNTMGKILRREVEIMFKQR
ncbi:MAG: malonyl-CoA synthase [Deltaproteobacteria bacterium]|nr:MAG: malonyl-CoA synthase [Deltaproteobacteria bacterium]